jgi:hypothetical protein
MTSRPDEATLSTFPGGGGTEFKWFDLPQVPALGIRVLIFPTSFREFSVYDNLP